MSTLEDLRWMRLPMPDLIPVELIEQIRDRDWEVEDWYKYQRITCQIPTENGISLNPLNHLHVLVDPQNHIKGVLWFVVDPLTKDMIIQNYSIDKKYWHKGKAVDKAVEYLEKIKKKAKLQKVYWITKNPKHSEKHGFKRSKSVLMEYKGESNGKDSERVFECRGNSGSIDSRAETGVEPNSGGRDSGSRPGCLPTISKTTNDGRLSKSVSADVCGSSNETTSAADIAADTAEVRGRECRHEQCIESSSSTECDRSIDATGESDGSILSEPTTEPTSSS